MTRGGGGCTMVPGQNIFQGALGDSVPPDCRPYFQEEEVRGSQGDKLGLDAPEPDGTRPAGTHLELPQKASPCRPISSA